MPFLLFGPPFDDIVPFGANFIVWSAFLISLELYAISALWLSSFSSLSFNKTVGTLGIKVGWQNFFTQRSFELLKRNFCEGHLTPSKERTRFFQKKRLFCWIFLKIKRILSNGLPDF